MADVARRAGVSRALVSIVMRNEPGASTENRERIWRAARELGYRPNSSARLLRRASSKHLGVIYTMTHGLDADLVEALYPVAEDAGFAIALGAITATRGWRRAAEELLEFRCEAIIAIAPEDDPRAFADISAASPVIAVGRRVAGIDAVHVNDQACSRLAVDHLAVQRPVPARLELTEVLIFLKVDGGEPLHIADAIPSRHQQSQRRALMERQRLTVHRVHEERFAGECLLAR